MVDYLTGWLVVIHLEPFGAGTMYYGTAEFVGSLQGEV